MSAATGRSRPGSFGKRDFSRTSVIAATSVAALNPRLIAIVHPSCSGLITAAVGELATRVDDMWEEDVTFAMERVREALEVLGGLFCEDGAMHEAQFTGVRREDDAAKSCHEAGWEMRAAARSIADALAARTGGSR